MGWADWPARLQHLAAGPLVGEREVWLDGGHNPSAARLVAGWARHKFGAGRMHLLFACLTAKDAAGILQPFAGVAAHVHCLPIAGHECRSPQELDALARELGVSASAHPDLESALTSVPQDAPVLIFGSLYLAGVVLGANGQVPD
jgi:dihydrofolate synthase/folylpolyglutamate synthase